METMKIKDEYGSVYALSSTKLQETNSYHRWVLLKDLKKWLKGGSTDTSLLVEEWPHILMAKHDGGKPFSSATWLTIEEDGRLSIGCKRFGAKATKAIFKAAGIRRKVIS
jgi:hypothetical protein